MKKIIKEKLRSIRKIWRLYIWDYKYCYKDTAYSEVLKSNYFADILNYFEDTIDIFYSTSKSKARLKNFEKVTTFLQTIYVHQDLIEETLRIFKTGIVKGNLQKNENYSINREIRNELIGHPLRFIDIGGKRRLLSSTLFHPELSGKHGIVYEKYHIKRDYSLEKVTHSKSKITKRHELFLNYYLDIAHIPSTF
jgi:hypothetical protein